MGNVKKRFSDKELYEPLLRELFDELPNTATKIREAWTFEWQVAGESAVLNSQVLETYDVRCECLA